MKLKIDPLTRIEGHLKVNTVIDNNIVADAFISGQMYRGFERFLINRNPIDAARITQRVCGVCHEVHGVASVLALEELYKIEPPLNGKILRDLLLGLHIITDHILHFYILSLPDYVNFKSILKYAGRNSKLNMVKNWVINDSPGFITTDLNGDYLEDTNLSMNMINNYIKAIDIRSKVSSGMAIVGAKVPFIHALLPGGITTHVNADTLMKLSTTIDLVSDFVKNVYLKDALDLAEYFKTYFNIGSSYHNFFCYSSFSSLDKPLYKKGIYIDGSFGDLDYLNIKEYLDASFYNQDGSPFEDKKGAYSWIKAPRYKNTPLETGPLARLFINKNTQLLSILEKYNVRNRPSSTMARIVARAIEASVITNHLYSLLNKFDITEPTILDFDLQKPVNGEGRGFSIAARGDLYHYVRANNGKVVEYNLIVPSTWNFGPTSNGYKGVVEKALIGTPVKYGLNANNSIEIGRVIRSFDPCLACSVH